MQRILKAWLDDARRNPNLRYVDTCDGIRAIAVLLVGWFHIWQQSWLMPVIHTRNTYISFDPLVRSGYIWVDMMILLSGFCLYLPWARERASGKAMDTQAHFYVKRLARIHPSYMLTIILMLVIAVMTKGMSGMLAKDLVMHMTYTQTFSYWTYYGTNLGASLWTLAIEMEFYLIFPFLAREFRKSPVMTFIAMTATALAFRFWAEMNFEDVSMLFNQLPAYLDTFAFGMLAAEVHVLAARRRHGVFSRILCSLGCVVVCMLFWQVVQNQARCSGPILIRMGQMHNRIWMDLLGASLIVLSANAGMLVRGLLSNPIMRFISAVSMQFYIWHQQMAVWILQLRLVPSDMEYPNYDGDLRWQAIFTAVCFVVPMVWGAILTYGFERPVARRILSAWDRHRKEEKK